MAIASSSPAAPHVTVDIQLDDELVTAALAKEIAYGEDAPWVDDEVMYEKLEAAGERYAGLIGWVHSSGVDPDLVEHLIADRTKYAHLIRKTPDGRPIWNEDEAEMFVQEITGYDRATGRRWLAYAWPT